MVKIMDETGLGKRIRMCRTRKGWSQETLAEKVGISIAYTGMIERGEKTPKLDTFIKIANALEVSADYLLTDALQTQLFADTSVRAALINSLEKESRDRIYDVVDALLRHEKSH